MTEDELFELIKSCILDAERKYKLTGCLAYKVSYPALKCGASPVPPAFTADGFIRELRAGSRVPHPNGLIIRWAKHQLSSSPSRGVIGNIPFFSRDSKYLKLPPTTPTHLLLAYPRFEKRGFASNFFIIANRLYEFLNRWYNDKN